MDDLDSFEEHDIPVTARVSESRYKGSKGGSKSSREKKGVRGSSKGEREGMMVKGRDIVISKTLSRLLRHQAKNAGIELDGEGFARVDKVVSSDFIQLSSTVTNGRSQYWGGHVILLHVSLSLCSPHNQICPL
jgi:hypothetical protein